MDNPTIIGSKTLRESVKEVGLNENEVKYSKDGEFSYVTDTDESLNRVISKKLHKRTGEKVASEEGTNNVDAKSYWIVDPIDGTIPFAHNMPNYVTMISFVENGTPVSSSLYSPETEQMFTADTDGAYLNGQNIKTKDVNTIDGEAVFCSIRSDGDYMDRKFKTLHNYFSERSIVFGVYCAGFSSVKIAQGGAVASVYVNLSEWDYMPTSHIVESAGGTVGELNNGETGVRSIAESNGKLVCMASSENVFEQIYEKFSDIQL